MSILCYQGVHLIAQLPTGVYACSYCHAQFHEHHEVQVRAGAGASLHGPRELTLLTKKEGDHGCAE